MTKFYGVGACASAIEYLVDIANGRRVKPTAAQMHLISEQAAQIAALLRDPLAQAAIDKMRQAQLQSEGL